MINVMLISFAHAASLIMIFFNIGDIVYTALFSATAAGIMVFSMNLKLPHKNRVEKILLLFNFFAIFFFMRYLLIELNGIPFYSMFAFYLVILIYLFGKFILYLSRNADK